MKLLIGNSIGNFEKQFLFEFCRAYGYDNQEMSEMLL